MSLAKDWGVEAPPEFMRFTLYYDGPLPSGADNARTRDKNRIRKKIHPQILQLFRDHPALPKPANGQDWAGWSDWKWPNVQLEGTDIEGWREKDTVTQIGDLHFVPLVRPQLDLVCELDIL